MVLSSRDRVKSSKQKSLKRKNLKMKRIHDNLILLRVTFSIIVLESLRRIARWVVFADITFFGNLPTPHHHTHYSRNAPALRGSGRHNAIIAIPGPLAIRSYTPHAFKGILFHSTLCHSTVLHATCSPMAGGEASR